MRIKGPFLLPLLTILFFIGAATSVRAQIRPTYQIGIMADLPTEESEAILERLKTEIQAVVGEDAYLEFPSELQFFNDFDLARAADQYMQIAEGGADLVLAFGYVNSRMLRNRQDFPLPTVLFGTTNQEIATFDLERQTSGIDNFTYLIALQSYEEDLQTFRELTEYQNIGIAIEANLLEGFEVGQVF